ncbi:MAG: CGNR zinc finger domain-containing protein [Gemmatimonadaceae bacterium]
MGSHTFELVGGNVALDFVNTIHDWTVLEPRDHIPSFAEALRFGAAASVLSPAEARRFAAMPSGMELRRLRELRSRLERAFRALVVSTAPLPADLTAIARDAAEAARSARLRRTGGQLVRAIDATAAGVATLRCRILEAALSLLTSTHIAYLKTCPSCGWFFLDISKNRSRRWCSMAACGSSAKARRYYWRNKRGR